MVRKYVNTRIGKVYHVIEFEKDKPAEVFNFFRLSNVDVTLIPPEENASNVPLFIIQHQGRSVLLEPGMAIEVNSKEQVRRIKKGFSYYEKMTSKFVWVKTDEELEQCLKMCEALRWTLANAHREKNIASRKGYLERREAKRKAKEKEERKQLDSQKDESEKYEQDK